MIASRAFCYRLQNNLFAQCFNSSAAHIMVMFFSSYLPDAMCDQPHPSSTCTPHSRLVGSRIRSKTRTVPAHLSLAVWLDKYSFEYPQLRFTCCEGRRLFRITSRRGQSTRLAYQQPNLYPLLYAPFILVKPGNVNTFTLLWVFSSRVASHRLLSPSQIFAPSILHSRHYTGKYTDLSGRTQ